MDEGYQWLKSVADQMQGDVAKGAAPKPERLTVRELLRRFNCKRRSKWINAHIGRGLREFKLRTDPDFKAPSLNFQIAIELVPQSSEPPSDPTRRIGTLSAANKRLTSIKPESPLKEATARMLMKDYSQLPVMKTDRDVEGIVSWQSIGTHRAMGQECGNVRQCMEHPEVVPSDARLFDAIRKVGEHGYVLVQRKDKTIAGIVTAMDVLELLSRLAGPFLFVGEIEEHLRNLVRGKFTLDQLRAASGHDQPIEGLTDLTFGGYCRLLENKENWGTLKLNIHRKEFVNNLETVRRIRNAIMHFDPDGLAEDDRQTIRRLARFFDKLAGITHS